jgi:hypothetical protein
MQTEQAGNPENTLKIQADVTEKLRCCGFTCAIRCYILV